jgi:hypothetical protein
MDKKLLLQMLLEKLDVYMQNTETRSLSLILYQYHSKWIKGLTIRPEILKQLQGVVGNTLEQIGIGHCFVTRTQKAQHVRERMKKNASNLKGSAQQKKWSLD